MKELKQAIFMVVAVIVVLIIALNIFRPTPPEPQYTDLQLVQMHTMIRRKDCYLITILPGPVDFTTGKESDCLSTLVAIHISIEEAAERIREYLEK